MSNNNRFTMNDPNQQKSYTDLLFSNSDPEFHSSEDEIVIKANLMAQAQAGSYASVNSQQQQHGHPHVHPSQISHGVMSHQQSGGPSHSVSVNPNMVPHSASFTHYPQGMMVNTGMVPQYSNVHPGMIPQYSNPNMVAYNRGMMSGHPQMVPAGVTYVSQQGHMQHSSHPSHSQFVSNQNFSNGMEFEGGYGQQNGMAYPYSNPSGQFTINQNPHIVNQGQGFKTEPGVWESLPSMPSPPTNFHQGSNHSSIQKANSSNPLANSGSSTTSVSSTGSNGRRNSGNGSGNEYSIDNLIREQQSFETNIKEQYEFETATIISPEGSPENINNYSPSLVHDHSQSSTGAFVRVPEQRRLFQGGKSGGRNPISVVLEVGFDQSYHAGSRCTLTVDCEKDTKWHSVKHIILDKPLIPVEFSWSGMGSSGNKRVELRITLATEGGPPLDTKIMAIGVYSNTNQRKSLLVSVALFYSAIEPGKVPAQFLKSSKKSSTNKKPQSSRTRDAPSEEMISLKSAQFWVNECWKLKFYNKEKAGLEFNPPDPRDWAQIIKTLRLAEYLTIREFERLVDWFFDAGEEALKVPEMWKRGAIMFCSTHRAEELLNRPDLFLIRFSSAGFLNFAFHQPSLPNNQGEIRPTNDEEVLYYIEILGKKGFNVVLKDRVAQVHEFLKEMGFSNNHKPREGKYGPIATMLSNKNPANSDASLPSTPSSVSSSPPHTPSGLDINMFDSNLKKRRNDEAPQSTPFDISVRSITRECDVGCIPIPNLETTLEVVRRLMKENLDDDQVSPKFYFAIANGSKISVKQESARTLNQIITGNNILIIEEGLSTTPISSLGY